MLVCLQVKASQPFASFMEEKPERSSLGITVLLTYSRRLWKVAFRICGSPLRSDAFVAIHQLHSAPGSSIWRSAFLAALKSPGGVREFHATVKWIEMVDLRFSFGPFL